MDKYFSFNKKHFKSEEFNHKLIDEYYNQGYVLTRIPGQMNQVRSLRVDLKKFSLNSENRRILRKTEDFEIALFDLPLPENDTNWRIINLGKTFYQEKFDDVKFSAAKLREILYKTQDNEGNSVQFNQLLVFYINNTLPNSLNAESADHTKTLGYCISYIGVNFLHYCYPFYDLNSNISNSGMGMMLKAIIWAQKKELSYIYLGSYSRISDRYKLQFEGLEWFDGESWSTNLEKLKQVPVEEH